MISDDRSTASSIEAAASFPELLARLNRSPPPWHMRATSKVSVTESVETLGAGLDPSVYEYAPGEMVEVLEIRRSFGGVHRGRTVHGWVSLLSLLGTFRVMPDVDGGAVWHHVDGSAGDISPSNSGVLVMESSDESDADEPGSNSGSSFDSQPNESELPPMPSPSFVLPEGVPPDQATRSREAPPLPAEGPLSGVWGVASDLARGGTSGTEEGRQRGLPSAEFFHVRRE